MHVAFKISVLPNFLLGGLVNDLSMHINNVIKKSIQQNYSSKY